MKNAWRILAQGRWEIDTRLGSILETFSCTFNYWPWLWPWIPLEDQTQGHRCASGICLVNHTLLPPAYLWDSSKYLAIESLTKSFWRYVHIIVDCNILQCNVISQLGENMFQTLHVNLLSLHLQTTYTCFSHLPCNIIGLYNLWLGENNRHWGSYASLQRAL